MAMGMRFVCQHCKNAIEAWDDGKPYYLDGSGQKRYAYHPSPERELCTGNDSPHLCLSCGEHFDIDSAAPIAACPFCNASEIASTFALDGEVCPACKLGAFRRDPHFLAVS
jgi:hypothetical protein